MRKIILLLLLTTTQLLANSQDFKFNAFLDQEVSCKGNNDGSIQATCTPEGDYKYVISKKGFTDSNPSGFFRGLKPGTYKVSATNGKVTKKMNVKVTEPKALTIKFVVEKYPTSQDDGGILTVNVSGGTQDLQPYLITWVNSQGVTINSEPGQNFSLSESNLPPDTYEVTIEDDHGCFLTKSYKLKKKK
mgnify:FL=1